MARAGSACGRARALSIRNSTLPRLAASVGQPSRSTAASSVRRRPRTSSGTMSRSGGKTARISASSASIGTLVHGSGIVAGMRRQRRVLELDQDGERDVAADGRPTTP